MYALSITNILIYFDFLFLVVGTEIINATEEFDIFIPDDSPPIFEHLDEEIVLSYTEENKNISNSGYNENDEDEHSSRNEGVFELCFLIESNLIILINLFVMFVLISNRRLRAKSSIRCFISLQWTHISLGAISIVNALDEDHSFLWSLITNGLLLEAFFSMLIQTLEKVFIIHFQDTRIMISNNLCFLIF